MSITGGFLALKLQAVNRLILYSKKRLNQLLPSTAITSIRLRLGQHTEKGENCQNPYHKDWKCGTQIKQICESVGGSDLHREIYSTFSDWHHWGIATMAESLSFSEDKILHTSSSTSKSAMALATGFQCLIETAELVNQHLGLGKELQLSAIHDEYLAWNKECGHLDEGVPSST